MMLSTGPNISSLMAASVARVCSRIVGPTCTVTQHAEVQLNERPWIASVYDTTVVIRLVSAVRWSRDAAQTAQSTVTL